MTKKRRTNKRRRFQSTYLGLLGFATLVLLVLTDQGASSVASSQDITVTSTSQNIILLSDEGLSIEIERFEFRSVAGSRREPDNDAWLIVYASLNNNTSEEVCVHADDIEFIQDGDERSPNNGAMGDIQDTLSPRLDYIGAYNGQCVDGESSEPTFIVFDVNLDADSVIFSFYDSEMPLIVDFPSSTGEIENFVSIPLLLPTEVPTRTPIPTATRTRTPTPIPMTTLYMTGSTANARECPQLNCEVVTVLVYGEEVSGLEQVDGAATAGSSQWWHVLYDGQEIYVHSSLVSTNRPVSNTARPAQQQQVQPISPVTQAPISVAPPAGSYSCNCSKTCSAMTCEEAYYQLNQCGCGQRDSDNDGVPCESVCPGG